MGCQKGRRIRDQEAICEDKADDCEDERSRWADRKGQG
jgi:hypothetical protein